MSETSGPRRVTLKLTVTPSDAGQTAPSLLARESGVSKARVKLAMTKGAVWLSRHGRHPGRLRSATYAVRAGDNLELHYDEGILESVPPSPVLISDRTGYSVWWKPAGLMTQGSVFGDHCSLSRLVEKRFENKREVRLVHRLDREASGLVLIAHTADVAARLSALFQGNEIEKEYRAEVLGVIGPPGTTGTIHTPLDGKDARTTYEVLETDQGRGTSTVRVFIQTGRTHQIRRHFEGIGHPVMGDPRYGEGNKNRSGLRLAAVALRFVCPVARQRVEYSAPAENAEPGEGPLTTE